MLDVDRYDVFCSLFTGIAQFERRKVGLSLNKESMKSHNWFLRESRKYVTQL